LFRGGVLCYDDAAGSAGTKIFVEKFHVRVGRTRAVTSKSIDVSTRRKDGHSAQQYNAWSSGPTAEKSIRLFSFSRTQYVLLTDNTDDDGMHRAVIVVRTTISYRRAQLTGSGRALAIK
jgi:hypothetical protein